MKHQIMKNLILPVLFFALAFTSNYTNAQGVAITDEDSYEADASAILDVNSTSRGLLPPRMTTEERDAIFNPVEGLIIFNISNNTLNIYDGTSWGSTTGTFLCGSSQVFDDEGNSYSTVQIGSQCWMTENLNTGIMINGSIDQSDNSTIEKYCYNNQESNCDNFGALYQWNEMMQYLTTEGVQGICPAGWHLPSDAEWCTLEQRIDPTVSCSGTGWRGTDAGTKLKQGGSSGFNGLLAGYRSTGGSFEYNGDGYFWTSSENLSGAWNRALNVNYTTSGRADPEITYGLSVRCVYNENTSKLPTVTTGMVSNIGGFTADVEGEITDLGIEGATIVHYGHCWSTNPDPTINDFSTDFGSSNNTVSYTSNLDNLNELTIYYIRAYAENGDGLTYGGEITFSTLSGSACPGVPTVTYGGQVYNTVQISSQCWLKENLNIGTMINGSNNQTNNSTIEKYCYNNELDSCDIYGGLYQWDEMMQYVTTEGTQGICPSGWHIPTDAEWCTLENEVDAGTISCSTTGWRGIDVGDNLKEDGNTHWDPGSTGTNISDFTLLPSGYRLSDGSFSDLRIGAYLRTSKEFNSNSAWTRLFAYWSSQIYHGSQYKIYGQSVRCLKD